MIQKPIQAKTRSSVSYFHLLSTAPWNRRKSKQGTKERMQTENRKFALTKILFVSVLKPGSDQQVNYFYTMERCFDLFSFQCFLYAKQMLMSLKIHISFKAF